MNRAAFYSPLAITVALAAVMLACAAAQTPFRLDASYLRRPDAPEMSAQAPPVFRVRLDTNKGGIVLEAHRDWAPRGADRFYNLVRAGYYDASRFFRVVKDKWAQFGIAGDPEIARLWRDRPIADDPFVRHSNVRGTVAYAFAVPNGRTTQIFINLQDNSATHDKEPFVVFAKVVEGMDVVSALNAEYGDSAGSGIRSGKQAPLFEGGNAYLAREFPRLDYIVRATITK
jgi:peptidyl-prolyl cis-trans isomerase A (cyclophilin A)